MDFLNIFRALYLYKKYTQRERYQHNKNLLRYSIPAYKVKENDIKITKKFQLAEFDSPKKVNMTKTHFAKTRGKTFQSFFGLD